MRCVVTNSYEASNAPRRLDKYLQGKKKKKCKRRLVFLFNDYWNSMWKEEELKKIQRFLRNQM